MCECNEATSTMAGNLVHKLTERTPSIGTGELGVGMDGGRNGGASG